MRALGALSKRDLYLTDVPFFPWYAYYLKLASLKYCPQIHHLLGGTLNRNLNIIWRRKRKSTKIWNKTKAIGHKLDFQKKLTHSRMMTKLWWETPSVPHRLVSGKIGFLSVKREIGDGSYLERNCPWQLVRE